MRPEVETEIWRAEVRRRLDKLEKRQNWLAEGVATIQAVAVAYLVWTGIVHWGGPEWLAVVVGAVVFVSFGRLIKWTYGP